MAQANLACTQCRSTQPDAHNPHTMHATQQCQPIYTGTKGCLQVEALPVSSLFLKHEPVPNVSQPDLTQPNLDSGEGARKLLYELIEYTCCDLLLLPYSLLLLSFILSSLISALFFPLPPV